MGGREGGVVTLHPRGGCYELTSWGGRCYEL